MSDPSTQKVRRARRCCSEAGSPDAGESRQRVLSGGLRDVPADSSRPRTARVIPDGFSPAATLPRVLLREGRLLDGTPSDPRPVPGTLLLVGSSPPCGPVSCRPLIRPWRGLSAFASAYSFVRPCTERPLGYWRWLSASAHSCLVLA